MLLHYVDQKTDDVRLDEASLPVMATYFLARIAVSQSRERTPDLETVAPQFPQHLFVMSQTSTYSEETGTEKIYGNERSKSKSNEIEGISGRDTSHPKNPKLDSLPIKQVPLSLFKD